MPNTQSRIPPCTLATAGAIASPVLAAMAVGYARGDLRMAFALLVVLEEFGPEVIVEDDRVFANHRAKRLASLASVAARCDVPRVSLWRWTRGFRACVRQADGWSGGVVVRAVAGHAMERRLA